MPIAGSEVAIGIPPSPRTLTIPGVPFSPPPPPALPEPTPVLSFPPPAPPPVPPFSEPAGCPPWRMAEPQPVIFHNVATSTSPVNEGMRKCAPARAADEIPGVRPRESPADLRNGWG